MNKLLANGSGPWDISRVIWAKSMQLIDGCSKQLAITSLPKPVPLIHAQDINSSEVVIVVADRNMLRCLCPDFSMLDR